MKQRARLNIAIVGAGRVGSVLGRVLVDNGHRVVCVVSRTTGSARRAGAFLRCRKTSTHLSALPPETGIVFIATPHDAVAEVARALTRVESLDFRRIAVCHASGMLTASVLDPVAARGATTFSFHPLQTFPRDFPPAKILPTARGIVYGVDGSPAGIRVARKLSRALDGRIVEIRPEMRELYHAACVVASNHLTTMMAVVEAMFSAAGGRPRDFAEAFGPIAEATLRNIRLTSPARALSGPVARGGVGTVARHLEVIAAHTPHLLPYFCAVSLETVRLATAKGSITAEQARQLTTLINDVLNRTPTEVTT